MCTFLDYFPVTTAVTLEQMRNKFDYNEVRGVRNWKRYYKMAKYNKSVNINWVENASATNQWNLQPAVDRLFFCTFSGGLALNNVPAEEGSEVPLGEMILTYYIEFRDRKRLP